jgi:putative heme transporter
LATDDTHGRHAVHPTVDRLAGYAWRFLVIVAAGAVVLWFAGRIRPALLPLVVALFLGRILSAPNAWLRLRGLKPALAAAITLVGFLALLSAVIGLVGVAVTGEFEELGPALSTAVDDVERWLVEDSPFDISREDIDRFRRESGQAVGDALRSSGDSVVNAAVLAGEIFLGLLLGLIVTFFFLKDGPRFSAWISGLLPPERRELTDALGRRAWHTLGGYLRGAALLGVVEGAAIAITLAVVGARLAVPMAVITFLAAFVPFAGAIVAAVLAVLVALGTAGPAQALVVAIVALVIQQLDNDVLAPIVYGRSLELHPVVVLLSIVAGGALFGLVGSFLAVPVTALILNLAAEARAHQRRAIEPPPS